jgi:hypothetical protein
MIPTYGVYDKLLDMDQGVTTAFPAAFRPARWHRPIPVYGQR